MKGLCPSRDTAPLSLHAVLLSKRALLCPIDGITLLLLLMGIIRERWRNKSAFYRIHSGFLLLKVAFPLQKTNIREQKSSLPFLNIIRCPVIRKIVSHYPQICNDFCEFLP